MNTRITMTSSAIFLAIIGIFLSFLPDEIGEYLSIESNIVTHLVLKMLSALYLGFAILNWIAKGTLIGGIYNRPIAMGNLMHFVVGAIAMAKTVSNIEKHSEIFLFLTVVYVVFTILFFIVFKNNPIKLKK